jgi:hypothetical protein
LLAQVLGFFRKGQIERFGLSETTSHLHGAAIVGWGGSATGVRITGKSRGPRGDAAIILR